MAHLIDRRVAVLALSALLAPTSALGQSLAAQGVGMRLSVRTAAEIPRANTKKEPFNTYTLFLGTQRDGVTAVSQALSAQFDQFGTDIGANNLAIFVANKANGALDISAGRTLLEAVAKSYKMTLDPLAGPYAVLLPRHPADPPQPGDRAVVVAFASKSGEDVAASISALRAEIALQRAAQATMVAGNAASGYGAFWQSILEKFNAKGAGGAKIIMSS